MINKISPVEYQLLHIKLKRQPIAESSYCTSTENPYTLYSPGIITIIYI